MRDAFERMPVRFVLGIAALFSGVALLGNIVFNFSLGLGLLVSGGIVAAIVAIVLQRADADQRSRLIRQAGAGALAGLTATVTYDGVKALLSQIDPSPYNPFEATEAFGYLLLGGAADPVAIQAAGIGLHLLNGTAFGVAFTILFLAGGALTPRSALLRGVAWGLFLETFQITLYPGWLDIRAFREFATISALSHVVYGATLGLLARSLVRRALMMEDWPPPP